MKAVIHRLDEICEHIFDRTIGVCIWSDFAHDAKLVELSGFKDGQYVRINQKFSALFLQSEKPEYFICVREDFNRMVLLFVRHQKASAAKP